MVNSKTYMESDAITVITSIAQVAEHHLLFVVRVGAGDASLALHTLPVIFLDDLGHDDRHIPTPGMSPLLAYRTADQLFHSGHLFRMPLTFR